MHKEYKRLSIEFPAEEYIYLKMACAKKDMSLKDFVTQALLKTIEDYEDELDLITLRKARTEENIKNSISWEEAVEKLGWNNL